MQEKQKRLVKAVKEDSIQAQIDLASYIETIASTAARHENTNIKGIRNTRKREQNKSHVDYANDMKEGIDNE